MMRAVLGYLWKLSICAVLMLFGTGLGGVLASALGLPATELPAGADAAVLGGLFLASNLLVALGLAVLAQGLGGVFPSRWLALSLLCWLTFGVNTALESAIFTEMGGGTGTNPVLYTIVTYAVPSLLAGATVALLFPGPDRSGTLSHSLAAFFAGRRDWGWAWRLAAAILSFVLIYLLFGLLVAPIVVGAYRSEIGGLTLPSIWQTIPMAFLRSALFLAACLPVLALWRDSRVKLVGALGLALFIMVGLAWQVVGYWLPLTLRVAHSVEILADSALYAAALVVLLPVSGLGR